MLSGTQMAVVAGAAFLPFLLSFISALRPQAKPDGVDDYFLYKRQLDTGTFATGSVGYSMQVASIYLFLYWYQLYGLWSLIVPVAWLVGYFLQGALVERGILDSFLAGDGGKIATIHGFIGAKSGAKRVLVWILAFTTIVGFGGTMLGEIDYALTYFVLPGLGITIATFWSKIAVFILVLVTAGAYIIWGGYRAAIDTDTTQVKAAFFLFALIIGAFSIGAAKVGHLATAIIICAGLIVFSLIAILSRLRLRKTDPQYRKMDIAYHVDMGVFFGMIAIGIVSMIIASFSASSSVINVANITAYSSKQIGGFGLWGIVALVFTNGLWQFIDVSSLQRLQSLKYDPKKNEDKKNVLNGLISAGWEGTGSWFMVIAFAILLKACGIDTTTPHQGMLSNVWLLSAFLYIVVAFMLSTLDTLVAATAYVVHYDYTRRFINENSDDYAEKELRLARVSTLIGLLITSVIYFGIKYVVRDDVLRQSSIIYAIYAIQASIFGPVIVSLLCPKRSSTVFAFIAIAAGWAAGLSSALFPNPWFGMSTDSWYVIPPFAALVASGAVSAIGVIFSKGSR